MRTNFARPILSHWVSQIGTRPAFFGTPSSVRRSGFTLVEIMIVVSVIALIAIIAIPNFTKSRDSARVKTCVASLRTLYGAKQEWALNQRKGDTAIPGSADIVPYLAANRMPSCPASGTYNLRRVSRTPTCSLYLKGHTLNNLNLDEDQFPD